MEKRILTAFILSFIVIAAWSAVTPRPKPRVQLAQTEPSMVPAQEEVAVPVSPEAVSTEKPEESITTLENEKIRVEFSNVGGAISGLEIKEFGIKLPVGGILRSGNAVYALEKRSDTEIMYTATTGDVKITKRYELLPDEYVVMAKIVVDKMSNLSGENIFTLDISRLDKNRAHLNDETLFEYYVISRENVVFRKGHANKFSAKDAKASQGEVDLIGFRDKYYALIIDPDFATSQSSIQFVNEQRMDFTVESAEARSEFDFTIYYGPQNLDLLKSYRRNFEKVFVFSDWQWLDGISKMIYYFMNFIHTYVKNWGLCIILISMFIYLSMYPLTFQSMLSMKKMQVLQPQLTKLREQYKNNPQRLNKEMVELYRENGVNPFGGCIPMVLQIPIFFGLYQVLWRSVSFKGADFLWIKDLAEPDRLFLFPFTLPFFGNELNILPIFMMVVMFIQQKLSTKNMVAMDQTQEMQQKMMVIMMPLFLGFIFYKFASGLTLYFTVFYLLSTLTQFKMSKLNVSKA